MCTYNLLVWKWIDEKFDIRQMYLLCFILVDTAFLLCGADIMYSVHVRNVHHQTLFDIYVFVLLLCSLCTKYVILHQDFITFLGHLTIIWIHIMYGSSKENEIKNNYIKMVLHCMLFYLCENLI